MALLLPLDGSPPTARRSIIEAAKGGRLRDPDTGEYLAPFKVSDSTLSRWRSSALDARVPAAHESVRASLDKLLGLVADELDAEADKGSGTRDMSRLKGAADTLRLAESLRRTLDPPSDPAQDPASTNTAGDSTTGDPGLDALLSAASS